VPSPDLRLRAVRLELLTLGSVSIEAIVALIAGLAARSIALVSFGLDSVIEFLAALVVLWQLRTGSERREDAALKVVAATFVAFAAYVIAESQDTLRHHHRPETSAVGIVLTVASLIVMQWLGKAKRQVGHEIANDALEADAAETLFCSYLAALVLVGLILNAAFGWWWADPVAALGVALLAIREGWEAWTGGHH